MSDEPKLQEVAPQRASVSDRRAQRQSAKPNKQQMRASQARVVKTAEAQARAAADGNGGGEAVALSPAAKRALERRGGQRGTGLPQGIVALTRSQEMTLIRGDMRRLLVIANVLLVGMLLLLFIID